MKSYVVGSEALRDLDEIWEYIAHDNLAAADSWIERLHGVFEAIAQTPGLGHRRADLTSSPVLFWSVGKYVIVYRDIRDMVQIVAVTQGSRDIPRLLSERGI